MKFRELINQGEFSVILFSSEWHHEDQESKQEIKHIGEKADVKTTLIDVDKNQDLCDALKIKTLPTVMVYKQGQMIYRGSGEVESSKIIELICGK